MLLAIETSYKGRCYVVYKDLNSKKIKNEIAIYSGIWGPFGPFAAKEHLCNIDINLKSFKKCPFIPKDTNKVKFYIKLKSLSIINMLESDNPNSKRLGIELLKKTLMSSNI